MPLRYAEFTPTAGQVRVFRVPGGMAAGAPFSWSAGVTLYQEPCGLVAQVVGVDKPMSRDEFRAVRECLEGLGCQAAIIERVNSDGRRWLRRHKRRP